ncbi:ABC transporter ATP-binding protein [Mesorhizobium sp. BAC0120]|uniref:ABC transporter ATP-binding protein n=1 Tax=Mesorhizobium sp. BAC0120 TaxID=3090670 RepID=UPI00298C7B0E|nr:ABC transporter ATP-binding protein [Mesorhizobium sp. BAC0120]MDW6025479.1 ABC transporter ATP-binding protein [Mesorhizobium sp. BAC0120]
MADALVAINGLGRKFSHSGSGWVEALAGVDCEIKPAARIALVGPSGSGKTTLLHIIGGLDAPTSGSIEWPALGSIKELRPRMIGCVFQTPSLFPALTAAQNVALPLILAGETVPFDDKVAGLMESFGLVDLSNKLPEELSGGQAQRVAMARALAIGPKLLLADEPTGQLDSHSAQMLFDGVFEHLEGTDTALVVATHDRNIASRMGTQWIMVHGRLFAEPDDGHV